MTPQFTQSSGVSSSGKEQDQRPSFGDRLMPVFGRPEKPADVESYLAAQSARPIYGVATGQLQLAGV